jgi:hypothetical protein
MKVYAGIGSRRRTPEDILKLMTQTATKLELSGYILRSGHAQGADQAFEVGVTLKENKEIYTPKDATFEAIKLAAQYHPYWDRCDDIVRKLHGRNSMIILGKNLKEPVNFVICFTPDGKNSGGTGIALNIAEGHNIPVFNLYFKTIRKRIENFVGKKDICLDLL